MSDITLSRDDALKVERLIRSIEEMTNELKNILVRENKNKGVKEQTRKKVAEKLDIGSRVIIKNTHGGHYGKRGKITSITRFFCQIQLDDENLILKRARKNVKVVN